MEAKDTVMSDKEIYSESKCEDGGGRSFYNEPFTTNLLRKQAEISFKAGIKTMVDWIRSNSYFSKLTTRWDDNGGHEHRIASDYNSAEEIAFPKKMWQAKLKEWDIEK